MSELTLEEAVTRYQEQAQAAVSDSMQLATADTFPTRGHRSSQILTTLSAPLHK
jgi:hypothetical protein